MKEKLTLQDIVDLLAKKNGLSKKDADAFFREFLEVVTNNIFNGEQVKVKDFGTFKLTRVSSRESVDVNTGEKIEIPAHYKLSFLPDKSLKDLVNKPFSQFETTLLEDAVSFDSLEESEEPAESPEDEDTSVDDTVEVIRQSGENLSLPKSDNEVERTKEDIETRIEGIKPLVSDIKKESEDKKTVKEEPKAVTPPAPSISYTYSYTTSSGKDDSSESITLVVPHNQIIIEPESDDVKPSVESPLVSEYKEEVYTDDSVDKETLDVEADSELDSDVPLSINKVQEKIDQLRDAIEALEKITWQGDSPENSLRDKPSVDEADVYNDEPSEQDEIADDEIPLTSRHSVAEEEAETEQEEDEDLDETFESEEMPLSPVGKETAEEDDTDEEPDILNENEREQRDGDLLKSLVAIDGDEQPEASNLPSRIDGVIEDEDSDLDFYDYDQQTEKKRKRRRIILIIFLLLVIGFGGYHFAKLFNDKVEYENYKGYSPRLTEGDTLPNSQVFQNLLDELAPADTIGESDTVLLDMNNEGTQASLPVTSSKPISQQVLPDESDEKPIVLDDDFEADSIGGGLGKVISNNLKIRVLRKAAYLKEMPQQETVNTTDNKPSVTTTSVQPATVAAIPATAVIKQGSTLRNLAGKYYGHGIFWVYIYEENKDKIKDFDNISAGLEIRLPDPKKYGINIRDPKSMDAARKKEQALFSGKR